jgi:hypothetical protein
MSPDKHGNRVFIWRRDFALCRRDNQLRFDTTTLEYCGDGEFNGILGVALGSAITQRAVGSLDSAIRLCQSP